jgi:putative membrane protein
MPSEAAGPDLGAPASDASECRLHPLSWLFVLITQLRPMVIPLVALLLFSRGDRWELVGLLSAGVVALYAFLFSIGFRYRLDRDEIYVREGVFGRTERHVPYARIQNIVQERNPLHRLFGVTTLRLESAGGERPEAVMNVITVREAARIEAILRGRGTGREPAALGAPEAPLLALAPREIVRLGLVTNRGMVAVGAAVALLAQFEVWEHARTLLTTGRGVGSRLGTLAPAGAGLLERTALAGVALVALVGLLKILSVAVAFVSFHGFRLWRDGERLRTETGLLTRRAATARRDKVQRLHIGETWLSRRLHRQWLWCDVAAGAEAATENDAARLRWLVPVGTPADVAAVAEEVAPGVNLGARAWLPLHPRATRRRFAAAGSAWTFVSAASAGILGWWALGLWAAALGWAWLGARGWARFSAFALDDEVLAYRAGWHSREWTAARVARGQVVVLRQSPFDRRHGMARVLLDTAGGGRGLRLEIPYLGADEARALAARLRAGIPAQ